MTQRDEIFEQLQVATTGRAAYICTPSGSMSVFDLTKQYGMLEAILACLADSNPFTDNLVRAPSLMGTGLYLNRVRSSVQRFDNNFALTNTYRINWSTRRTWASTQDTIYAAQSAIQQLSGELARASNGSRADFTLSNEQLRVLESVLGTVQNRQASASPMDHWYVSYTLVGKITDHLRLERRRDFYHYTFNYCYSFAYNVLEGFKINEDSAQFRLGLAQPCVTEEAQFANGFLQLHPPGALEDVPVDDEVLNRVKLFNRHEPEEVYRDWLPKPETLSLAIEQNEKRLSLFKRNDLKPDERPVKKLSDMITGDKLNVPVNIEMFDIFENSSHRLEPGVYQFFLKEEPYFEGNMFDYTTSFHDELKSYRVLFPSGKIASITPSSKAQVVTRANIIKRELSLPQDVDIEHSHQINKNF